MPFNQTRITDEYRCNSLLVKDLQHTSVTG